MSALSRFGPAAARSVLFHHQRHMASASIASDPVQKLFLDKVKEFKASNKGLDEAHQKAMGEEIARLRRVYRVEDENKLAHIEHKFPAEHTVSLHDLDDSKELRDKIESGEYQKQLIAQPVQKSALMASIRESDEADFLHLPKMNKPDPAILLENAGVMPPPRLADQPKPDYDFIGDKMTPERLQRDLLVRFGPDMPTIHDDKSPERDLVNFPRQPILENSPPTRFHFLPESWFRFFYPKTGVTGPYAFATTFTTFLLSKEWLVYEHELLTGISITIVLGTAIVKFGPKVTQWLDQYVQKEVDDWEAWRTGSISMLEKMQKHYGDELKKNEFIDQIYQVRKQDVDVQLESEYRARLKTVYDDTRRRLNYLVSVADSQRQIAHNNMVNWVITNAVASFGPKQENEILDSCISNLKQLAGKNANVI